MIWDTFSLDENIERQKIEAVKQEKLKLEIQLKGLILLQNRLAELGELQSNEPLLHHKLVDFNFDIPEGISVINALIEAAKTLAIEQIETGILTKGSLRSNFA